MSGKKAGEVAAVLGKAEQIRAAAEANYRNAAQNGLDRIRRAAGNLNQLKQNVKGMKLEISADTGKELRAETEALEKTFCELLRSAEAISDYSPKAAALEKQCRAFDTELQKLDFDARRVRESVKQKRNGWYCDDEFREAETIQSNMRMLSDKKEKFLHELKKQESEIVSDETKIQAVSEQIKKLMTDAQKLNQRAAEMAKLRQQAGAARDEVQKMAGAVDAETAKKFLSEEYTQLCGKVKTFCGKPDTEVVTGLSGMMEEISAFSIRLNRMHEEWKASKAETEQYLERVKEQEQEGVYYHPNQYVASPEKAERLKLYTFLSAYSSADYQKQISALLRDAQQLFQKEQFETSRQKLMDAEKLISQAQEYAGLLQSQLIATVQLAADTRDIMVHAGFKVKARFVNGKDARDGFCIKCEMGDEIIDFEKIMMTEDGSVVMEIDHTEGANACGTSWKQLQSRFNEAGIPIVDVKKDNHSVLYGESPEQRPGKPNRLPQH